MRHIGKRLLSVAVSEQTALRNSYWAWVRRLPLVAPGFYNANKHNMACKWRVKLLFIYKSEQTFTKYSVLIYSGKYGINLVYIYFFQISNYYY